MAALFSNSLCLAYECGYGIAWRDARRQNEKYKIHARAHTHTNTIGEMFATTAIATTNIICTFRASLNALCSPNDETSPSQSYRASDMCLCILLLLLAVPEKLIIHHFSASRERDKCSRFTSETFSLLVNARQYFIV